MPVVAQITILITHQRPMAIPPKPRPYNHVLKFLSFSMILSVFIHNPFDEIPTI